LRERGGAFEAKALIQRDKLGMTEQPGAALRLGQRGVDQLPSHPLAPQLRGNEQTGKPMAVVDGPETQACNDARGARHPKLPFIVCTHARALLAVEMVEQAAFGANQLYAVQRSHGFSIKKHLRQGRA